MKIHPRHTLVEEAARDLFAFLLGWRKRHKLTMAEALMLVGQYLHERLAEDVRYERGKE